MTGVARKKILVIDDSPLVLELTRGVLEEAGFAVAIASNLTAFEEERRRTPPDLILVDVQMPEAFGDDVGQLLRDVRRVGVPIILFSSLSERALAERTEEAGLTGYVPKAAGVGALLERIKGILGESS